MKHMIIQKLKENALKTLESANESYKSTMDMATSGELKSDGKYDTRAIETGYLASAQKKRIEELEQEINLIDSIEFTGTKEISIGSLVLMELKSLKSPKKQTYFISSAASGTLLNIDNKAIMVISAFSPLGNEMMGLKAKDSFELETPKEIRTYFIEEVN